MIFTELDYGEVRSERRELDLVIEASGERFQVPVRFVEGELNLGPIDGFTLSYGATLSLTKLGPAAFRALGPTTINRGFRLANVGGVYILTRGDLHLCLELEAVPSVDPARGGELVSWYRLFRSAEGEDALVALRHRVSSVQRTLAEIPRSHLDRLERQVGDVDVADLGRPGVGSTATIDLVASTVG